MLFKTCQTTEWSCKANTEYLNALTLDRSARRTELTIMAFPEGKRDSKATIYLSADEFYSLIALLERKKNSFAIGEGGEWYEIWRALTIAELHFAEASKKKGE